MFQLITINKLFKVLITSASHWNYMANLRQPVAFVSENKLLKTVIDYNYIDVITSKLPLLFFSYNFTAIYLAEQSINEPHAVRLESWCPHEIPIKLDWIFILFSFFHLFVHQLVYLFNLSSSWLIWSCIQLQLVILSSLVRPSIHSFIHLPYSVIHFSRSLIHSLFVHSFTSLIYWFVH